MADPTGDEATVRRPRRRPSYFETALAASLTANTASELARAIGKSLRTAERFRAAYRVEITQARASIVESAIARLRAAMPKVAAELEAIAFDKSEPAYCRTKALCELRETYMQLTQRAELETRLAELEAHIRSEPARLGTGMPTLLSAVALAPTNNAA